MIAAMDRAQLQLCDEIVAGRDYRDVHLSAAPHFGDVMHRAGIIKISGQSGPGIRRNQRVLPAWHRAFIGAAGPRCGRRHG